MRVACPCCQKQLDVADIFAGARINCPDCGSSIAIPNSAHEAVLDFRELLVAHTDTEATTDSSADPRGCDRGMINWAVIRACIKVAVPGTMLAVLLYFIDVVGMDLCSKAVLIAIAGFLLVCTKWACCGLTEALSDAFRQNGDEHLH
jgi:hypothetical protein